jgi:hypothetical protein
MKFGFLLYVAQAQPFADGEFSVIGIFGAGQNSQQSRLPRAVRSDEPNSIPLGNGEGDVLEEWIGSESFRDAAYVNQRWQGCAGS